MIPPILLPLKPQVSLKSHLPLPAHLNGIKIINSGLLKHQFHHNFFIRVWNLKTEGCLWHWPIPSQMRPITRILLHTLETWPTAEKLSTQSSLARGCSFVPSIDFIARVFRPHTITWVFAFYWPASERYQFCRDTVLLRCALEKLATLYVANHKSCCVIENVKTPNLIAVV